MHRLAVVGAAFLLGGCSAMVDKADKLNQSAVAAKPIQIDPTTLAHAQSGSVDQKKEFLGGIALQSEQKCNDFVSRLVVAENTVNTTGDILATILSALGTAFAPIATVHALTAGATVVSGSKAAIDSDIYAKASIANFQTALNGTYYKDIGAYVEALPKMQAKDIVVSVELSKIESIHASCGLAAAETSIAATISPVKPAKPAAGGAGAATTHGSVPGSRIDVGK